MQKALINPKIIRWAMQTRNINEHIIVKKLNKKHEDFIAWLEGNAFPTFKQAQQLAKILGIPFGYLYLKKPPEEKLPVPDFRTIENQKPVSNSLRNLLLYLEQKQLFLEEFFKSENYEELNFIGKYNIDNDYKQVAKFIRNWLEIEKLNKKNFLEELIEKLNQNRIFVFRNTILENNTHKRLDIEEIRGAVFVNKYAPLIFINENDTKKAQIFTLIHEIVHILINKSEFSDIKIENINKIEVFCNKVTAEVLLPEEKLSNLNLITSETIKKLSDTYNISQLATLYKLLNTEKISQKQFNFLYEYLKKEYEKFQDINKRKKAKGGDFYKTIQKRYGKNFLDIVKYSLLSEKITYKEASDLLNIKLNTLYKVLKV